MARKLTAEERAAFERMLEQCGGEVAPGASAASATDANLDGGTGLTSPAELWFGIHFPFSTGSDE